jgi:hypothetical protein
VGVSKFPKLGLLWFWGPITFCSDLRLKWGPKKSYSPCRELFKGMSHVPFTQRIWGDSRLLMVGSQTTNLTPGLFFGHNLCFKSPNGSREPILDIYVLKAFQRYKELLNLMGFDPWNYFLKIQKSIRTPTLKVRVHLGVWGFIPSHSLTLWEHKM